MRSLLGKFLGGKGGAKSVVQDLLRDLQEGERVSAECWERCRSSDELEDVLADELPRETLSALASTRPECVLSLVQLCLESIEEVLPKQEMEEADELSLANAMIVLTRILAAGPGGQPKEPPTLADSIPESTPLEVQFPLLRLLWEKKPAADGKVIDMAERSGCVAERIIDASMRALFLEGFTIDYVEDRKADAEGGEQTREIVNGIDCESMWYIQVGPTGDSDKEGQPEPNDETRENRCVALQLLLAALCGGAPAVVLKEEEEEDAKEASKPPARGRGAPKESPEKLGEKAAEEARLADMLAQKQLVTDPRFLAYWQDPESNVPLRGELLYSLLGFVLDYDPHGFGVPYAGFFSGGKQENFVSLGLQVLSLLLHSSGDSVSAGVEEAVVTRKPQELLGSAIEPPQHQQRNIFHSFLATVSSEREVEFVSGGLTTLFGMVGEDRRSYLPGSTRLPCFLTELLVLVYHFSGCPDFVKGLCSNSKDDEMDPAQLADSVLQLSFQGVPEHVKEDDAIFIGMATLMRLTAYREFCDKLNEDYDGEAPDDLPNFTGSFADLIVLAAVKQASDKIATAQVNELHRSIVEVALSTLCNVSVFAEGLCMDTCLRLFKLLERCGKVQVLKKGRNSLGVLLPRLLEVFQNIVQYQYGSSVDVVYGLMTREALLRDIISLCREKTQATNGHSTSNDSDTSDFPLSWWEEVQERLQPVEALLDAVVPILTAEVEKQDVSSANDAKKFMPRTALGLLPVPHAFQLRTIYGNSVQHRACERCLVACVAHGPSGLLWEDDEEDEDSKAKPSEANTKASASTAANGSRRERSSSLRRGSADGSKRSSSRTRRAPAEVPAAGGQQPPQPPQPSPLPIAAVPPITGDLQVQLQAAAASGVDIGALVQMLAAQQAAAAAASAAPAVSPAPPVAGYPPAAPVQSATPLASSSTMPARAAVAVPGLDTEAPDMPARASNEPGLSAAAAAPAPLTQAAAALAALAASAAAASATAPKAAAARSSLAAGAAVGGEDDLDFVPIDI